MLYIAMIPVVYFGVLKVGTANYWRHVVSKKVFCAMDDYIWNKIYNKFWR